MISWQAGLHERENFLKQAQSERVQFFAALQSLTNWVKDAEGHLQSDYDGFDFEKLPDQLEEQKVRWNNKEYYFKEDLNSQDLCLS